MNDNYYNELLPITDGTLRIGAPVWAGVITNRPMNRWQRLIAKLRPKCGEKL